MEEAKLNEMMSFVLEQVKDGTGFVREQAPLVAQEIVRYELWSSSVRIIWMAVVIVTLAIAVIKAVKRGDFDIDAPMTRACFSVIASVLLLLASVFGVVVIAENTTQVVKCLTSPRLVVLDYLKTLK
jgi:hypothetical protein